MTTQYTTKIVGLSLSILLAACGGVAPEDTPRGNTLIEGKAGGKTDQVTACMPVCDAIGSRSEGWYDSCTGELIGWAHCSGCEAKCDAIGSRSEGWYSVGPKRHCKNAGKMSGNLIGWDKCSTPDPKTCEADSDCVAVNTTCCSCSMGGTLEAFHKDYADLFVPENCFHDTACLAVYRCIGSPACVDGQCQMVSDPEPEPKICGPFPGGECMANEVCNMETCAIGGSGTCVPQPQICIELYAPVCGCDGQTYGNDCNRVAAGTGLAYEGECLKKTCNPMKAYCKMMPPVCPAGQVPEVVNGCWGKCVDITDCSCDVAGDSTQCPLSGFTCQGTTNTCAPYTL